MDPKGMLFLLVVILAGVPVIILFYYGAQFALRFLKRPAPARVTESVRTVAPRIAYSPAAPGPGRAGAEISLPAAIRFLPSQEGGLPYASRSR
jgi:hypothetical protein